MNDASNAGLAMRVRADEVADTSVAEQPASDTPATPWQEQLLAFAFAATIFLSAFLLFQVQPLVNKYILPWFGGSPAVWTATMLFFQVALFGGYTYSHVLAKLLGQRTQIIVHLVLLVTGAIVALWQFPPAGTWKPLDSNLPVWRIMVLLTCTVGLPYFALSTTGPLVQSWFARAFPGASPYRLYALSNIGSLLALLTFPFVFEPYLELGTQATAWSLAFVAFGLLCATCAWQTPAGGAAPVAEADGTGSLPAAPERPISWTRRLLWIALPAWSTIVWLAVTNHVCQDVVPIPFLQVIPFSLYLLTFIICFDYRHWYRRVPVAAAAVIGVLLASGHGELESWINAHVWADFTISFTAELAIYFGALFLVCMVCHGELVKLRPDPAHLTEFYLCMSGGGALGGLFVSIVAPFLFRDYFEWKIGLVGSLLLAALVCAVGLRRWMRHSYGRGHNVVPGLAAAAGIALAGLIVWWEYDPEEGLVYQFRNFFGKVSVYDIDAGKPDHYRSFVSGGVPHGRQFQEPAKRRWATTYYGPQTGAGRVLTFLGKDPRVRVGVIGTGVGTLASYAEPGQYYRFYDINPEVDFIAHKYFTYLADLEARGAKKEVVIADARLAMEREDPQQFDAIILDAFSSDSIPAHLLTKECFAIYLKHLRNQDEGAICVHITNRYLNLEPVVLGLAKHYHLKTVQIYREMSAERKLLPEEVAVSPETRLRNRTYYVVLTRNEKLLAELQPFEHPPDPPYPPVDIPLWTDSYSNVFRLLIK